jgi:hypothetical protein
VSPPRWLCSSDELRAALTAGAAAIPTTAATKATAAAAAIATTGTTAAAIAAAGTTAAAIATALARDIKAAVLHGLANAQRSGARAANSKATATTATSRTRGASGRFGACIAVHRRARAFGDGRLPALPECAALRIARAGTARRTTCAFACAGGARLACAGRARSTCAGARLACAGRARSTGCAADGRSASASVTAGSVGAAAARNDRRNTAQQKHKTSRSKFHWILHAFAGWKTEARIASRLGATATTPTILPTPVPVPTRRPTRQPLQRNVFALKRVDPTAFAELSSSRVQSAGRESLWHLRVAFKGRLDTRSD